MFTIHEKLEKGNHSQPRVTALLSCQENLMPLSWHMPISKEPFRYAVAVREENYSHQLIQKHGSFTLNFLPYAFMASVDLCARVHGDANDKLSMSQLSVFDKSPKGDLLLSDSDFIYECRVCDTYKNGDHTIFIAEVKRIFVNENQSREPLLFLGRGRYTTTSEVVQIPKED